MSDAVESSDDEIVQEDREFGEWSWRKFLLCMEVLLSPVNHMNRKWEDGRKYAKESATIAISGSYPRIFLVAFADNDELVTHYRQMIVNPPEQTITTRLGSSFQAIRRIMKDYREEGFWVSAADVSLYNPDELKPLLRAAQRLPAKDWLPDRYEYDREHWDNEMTLYHKVPNTTDDFLETAARWLISSILYAEPISLRLHLEPPAWVGANRYAHAGVNFTHESLTLRTQVAQPSDLRELQYAVSYSAHSDEIIYRRFDINHAGQVVSTMVYDTRSAMIDELYAALRRGNAFLIAADHLNTAWDEEAMITINTVPSHDGSDRVFVWDYFQRKVRLYEHTDVVIWEEPVEEVENLDAAGGVYQESECAIVLLLMTLAAPCIPSANGLLRNYPGVCIQTQGPNFLEYRSTRDPLTGEETYHQINRRYPHASIQFANRRAMVRNMLSNSDHEHDQAIFFDFDANGPLPAAATNLLTRAKQIAQVTYHDVLGKRYMITQTHFSYRYEQGAVDILSARDIDYL